MTIMAAPRRFLKLSARALSYSTHTRPPRTERQRSYDLGGQNFKVTNAPRPSDFFYSMMDRVPIPSVSSFNEVLAEAIQKEPFPVLLGICDHWRKAKLSYDDDTCGSAMDIFRTMIAVIPLPFFVHFTQILNFHVYMENYLAAIYIFHRLRRNGVFYDERTMNLIVKSFCNIERVDLGYAVFGLLIKSGFMVNVINFNALISGCCKGVRLIEAEDLIAKMRFCGVAPDIISYNCLLDGFSQQGHMAKAKDIFRMIMDSRRLEADVITFSCFLHGYCLIGFSDLGYVVLGAMIKYGVQPNISTFSHLLKGLFEESRVTEVVALFKKLIAENLDEVDTVAYSIMIDGFFKHGRVKDAECILGVCIRKNQGPNIMTCNSMLYGFCELGQMNKAWRVVRFIYKEGLKVTVVTYNCLMRGFCVLGKVDEAFGILREVPSVGLKNNIIGYNTILDGLFSAGRCQDAWYLVEEMMEIGLKLDVFTFNTVIKGMCLNRDLDAAFAVIKFMESRGVAPDIISYTTIIYWLCKIGELKVAVGLFNSLQSRGLKPNVLTFNVIIEGLCEGGFLELAKSILGEMELYGCQPDDITWKIMKRAVDNE